MNIHPSLLLAFSWSNAGDHITRWIITVAVSAAIFFVGKWVADKVRMLLARTLESRKVDPALAGFLTSIIYYLLLAFVVISALSRLGIPVSSLVVVLGAAGLAIGLALQGSLSNFASGVMIILFKPFVVGDFILAGGTSGIVKKVEILTTTLHTPDGKKVICPNSAIMSATITNITANDTRRVDLEFGIGYGDDIDLAKATIMEVLKSDERVLAEPAPTVDLSSLGDSSVNLVARAWVEKANWWPVFTQSQEKVKKAFDAKGVSIPFPQRDVHLYQESNTG